MDFSQLASAEKAEKETIAIRNKKKRNLRVWKEKARNAMNNQQQQTTSLQLGMEDEESQPGTEKFFLDFDVKAEVELTDKSTQTYSHESLLAIRTSLSRKRPMESPLLVRDDMIAKASKSKSPTSILPPLPGEAADRAKALRDESLRLNEQLKYFRSSITSSHSDMMNSLEKKVHDFLKDSKIDSP